MIKISYSFYLSKKNDIMNTLVVNYEIYNIANTWGSWIFIASI